MFLNFLKSLFSLDIGIDLGTANILIYVKGKGIVCSEPSVVATRQDRSPLAFGAEAKMMLGKTPGEIKALRPLKDGVIAYFEETEEMIKYFIRKVHNKHSFVAPRIVISIPYGITMVEKKAVEDATLSAGARKVYLIEEPRAAAIGAGLAVNEPRGCMIVDIGGGTTEVAILSLGGIVIANSIRYAGDKMDQHIAEFIRSEHNLLIGERTSENIKITVGSAAALEEELTMDISGREIVSGLPRNISITSEEIRQALIPPVTNIINVIKITLEKTPPELSSDIAEDGIMLAGGGALLHGLDVKIFQETGLKVRIADDPLTCVVKGTGKVLETLDK
ncbi:rod shape-determining protein [Candidatus Calescamantes bacterium]|nr:rod shape-determining protein [bacterium]MCK5224196.1 rod shape-determining protein [Candidatus Calescamantes bacterium]MCK5399005.1 rod shape-determining protein [bacterium]